MGWILDFGYWVWVWVDGSQDAGLGRLLGMGFGLAIRGRPHQLLFSLGSVGKGWKIAGMDGRFMSWSRKFRQECGSGSGSKKSYSHG
ncbi:hypothetical protein WN944_005651 [Citrus x changshan-huyou]|uniref:Uncharacterized protein n=1 Tax=Citrus x changshan-huyou TaxID=2935761 RepID=A0AAP0MMI9_9ROSI